MGHDQSQPSSQSYLDKIFLQVSEKLSVHFYNQHLFSRPEKSKFVGKVLEMASASIHQFHLQDLLSYLLLVSYSSRSLFSLKIEKEVLRYRSTLI